MTVQIYKSTDASAPSLDGQAGSLITVLDACLVDGFGALAAAGWTKDYSGTNKAAYRNDPVLGSGRFFQVIDDGTPAPTNFHVAGVRGYATMSDVDTGVEPFPTVAQKADGMLVRKAGASGSATVIAWCIIADEQFAYMFLGGGSGWTSTPTRAAPASTMFMIGDVIPNYGLDQYAVLVACTDNESGVTTINETKAFLGIGTTANASYLMRNYLAAVGSIAVGALKDSNSGELTYSGRSNPGRAWSDETGIESLSTWTIRDADALFPRGKYPGFLGFDFTPPAAMEHFDTFDLGGKTYTVISTRQSSSDCVVAIQSTGDWRA